MSCGFSNQKHIYVNGDEKFWRYTLNLQYFLLGLLAYEPRTGYSIKRYFDNFGRFLRSNTQMSQIYRTLDTMEHKGLATSELAQEPNPRRARVYSITEKGYTLFLDWLSGTYVPPSRFLDPQFDVRINFGAFLTKEQLLGIIDTELEVRKSQVARYRKRNRYQDFGKFPNPHLADILAEWSHKKGAESMDLHIKRVEELRQIIQSLDDRADPRPYIPAFGEDSPNE
ncbi:MAG: PadR family transcriptional regulator [Bifidobacterium sp.]|jgi:DNA-binding PadR family transcriptional regulator|nr:PadR family transcriptional regulator [Bifidobacterium sp.]MCI1865427.1 PadR family transcriptional regulator [Bifidobacterium sp.]